MNQPKGQPLQPIYTDAHGTARFKKNAIVEAVLLHSSLDMNKLAAMDFTDEDREQFAQLIGYSVYGFSELSYVSDETVQRAEQALFASKQAETKANESQD